MEVLKKEVNLLGTFFPLTKPNLDPKHFPTFHLQNHLTFLRK